MTLATFATLLAVGRVLIGLAPIVAAAPASRLLGFPDAHDNPTARLMGRLFGVRDIGLGALVAMHLDDPAALRNAFWLNLAMDLGDAAMIAVLLGALRVLPALLVIAIPVALAWLRLRKQKP